MLAQLYGNRQLVDCRQNNPPLPLLLCRFLDIAVADSLRCNRQPGHCGQIDFSLPESQFVAVTHHLLRGKSVTDSAAVPAKTLHSYAGNQSVSTRRIVHSNTALTQRI